MEIQDFDFNINILRSLLWRHNTAPRLESIMRAKDSWYAANYRDFWNDWVRDVFDLRTANAFGLQVWARILNVPLQVALPPDEAHRPAFGFGNVANAGFKRASPGAYIDPVSHIYKMADVDVPRYEGGAQSGLMLEQEATNLCVWSEDTTKYGGNTETDQAVRTPVDGVFGSLSATRVTVQGVVSGVGYANLANVNFGAVTDAPMVTFQANKWYCYSIFVRTDDPLLEVGFGFGNSLQGTIPNYHRFTLRIKDRTLISTGVAVGTFGMDWGFEEAPNGFVRLWVTAQSAGDGTPTRGSLGFTATRAGDTSQVVAPFDVECRMIEVVPGRTGPSSPIKTNGATVTRAADVNLGEYRNRNFNNGNFSNVNGGTVGLTVEQQRLILRLRYFQLTSRCTTGDINRICSIIFRDYGNVYVLDRNDMSYVIYVFDFSPGSQLKFLLEQYDLLPRPAGVGIQYNIITRKVFGFGEFNINFNNGTFTSDPKQAN